MTPLMLASREGHLSIARLLLESGAEVNLANNVQRVALHFASIGGHLEVIKTLVAFGANVNLLTKSGESPALDAARFNRRDAVAFLIKQGADLSAADSHGASVQDWLNFGGVQGRYDQFLDNESEFRKMQDQKSEAHVRLLMRKESSLEEFVAKNGRFILVYSYGGGKFEDPEIEKWAKRVAELLFTPGFLAECEERYLTGDELDASRKNRRRLARSKVRNEKRIENSKLQATLAPYLESLSQEETA